MREWRAKDADSQEVKQPAAVVAFLLVLIKKIWLVDRKMPPDDRSIPRTTHILKKEGPMLLQLCPISVSQSYNLL